MIERVAVPLIRGFPGMGAVVAHRQAGPINAKVLKQLRHLDQAAAISIAMVQGVDERRGENTMGQVCQLLNGQHRNVFY
jgi:hypothetical protein